MPSDEIMKDKNFDESAKPGFKQALKRFECWWDLKHYRRYTKAVIGWTNPITVFYCFPVAIGHEVAILQDPFSIKEEEYDKAKHMAKEGKYFAEVKWADKDPDINKWENELLESMGHKAMVNEDGKLICNIIPVPDRVKKRFIYE